MTIIEPHSQPSPPRLTAVIGPAAAGKDALADYLLRRHGITAIEIGAFARKLSEEVENDEPHLQYDPSARDLAGLGPEYVISQLVAETVENGGQSTPSLVITGLRSPAEVMALKSHFGDDMQLVYIKGGGRLARFDRVQQRDFATDPDNYADFVQQDEQLRSDYALAETAALADVTLVNNGSLESFYAQIEQAIVPHLLPTQQP